jgi:hypothetical protein
MRPAHFERMTTRAAVDITELPADVIAEPGPRNWRRLLLIAAAAAAMAAAGLVVWGRMKPRTEAPVKFERRKSCAETSRRA